MVICASRVVKMNKHLLFCSNTCSGVWLNTIGKNRESNDEHDEDCVEEEFQLPSEIVSEAGKQ